MHFLTAILIATSLVSVTKAGPTWNDHRCATECRVSKNYLYDIGFAYEYNYRIETFNEKKNMVMILAKVLIQPISACDHVLTLKDVFLVGSKKSEEFATAVMKESVSFSFQDGKVENVCSSETEPLWVLNFKKGIISSFQNSMTELDGVEVLTEKDISGVCETKYVAEKIDQSIRIKRSKDQSSCKGHAHDIINSLSAFGYSTKTFVQDLSLFHGEQMCEQKIVRDIITEVKCSQTVNFAPFARMGETQSDIYMKLSLSSIVPTSLPITARLSRKSSLEYQETDSHDTSSDVDNVDHLLVRLGYISDRSMMKEVPALFSELVASLRTLDVEQMETLYSRFSEKPQQFMKDALMLVESSAAMQMIIKLIKEDVLSASDQDAFISSLSLIKNPELQMFSAIQPLFETKLAVKALFGVSSMVHNYCSRHTDCQNEIEINTVVRSFESFLGSGCRMTTAEEKTKLIFALKALGNAGIFVNAKRTLERCYTEDNDMEVRIAAIEAWRRTPEHYSRENLLATYQDRTQDNEIRIAAYLAVMVHPTKDIIESVKENLISEGVNQVASFVWTHMTNLQESAFPEKQSVRELIGEDLLQKKFNPEALKFSRNFESSFMFNNLNVGGMTEANVIFSSQSFLPRSAMINFNVDAGGKSVNLFEIGGRIEGFESFIEKFFGKDGYYPEETVEAILKNMRQQKQEEITNLESYLTKSSNDPQGSFYMKMFGNDFSYKHFNDLKELMPEFDVKNPMEMIVELLRKGEVDYTKNFNILDIDVNYPTIIGLPLNLKVNSAATVNLQAYGSFNFDSWKSMNIKGYITPSAAINIEGSMTIDAFVTKTGVKYSALMHSTARIDGKALVKDGEIVDFEVNLPNDNDIIYEFTNEKIKFEDEQEMIDDTQISWDLADSKCRDFVFVSVCRDLSYFERKDRSTGRRREMKYHIKSTDSSSPLKFRYINNDEKLSILFKFPDNLKSSGFDMTFDKQKKELHSSLDYPKWNLNHSFDAIYNLNDDTKQIAFSLFDGQKKLYGAEVNYKQVDKLRTVFFEIDNPEGKIAQLEGTYKYDDENIDLKLEGESYIGTSKQSFKIDYSPTRNHFSIDVQSLLLIFQLTTDALRNGNEIIWDINGNIHVVGVIGPLPITGRGSYMYQELPDGTIRHSGMLNSKELHLDSAWYFAKSDELEEIKVSGTFVNSPFNFYTSSAYPKGNALIDKKDEMLISLPMYDIDIIFTKITFFDANNFKSDLYLKYNSEVTIKKTFDWKFGQTMDISVSLNTMFDFNFKCDVNAINTGDGVDIKYDGSFKRDAHGPKEAKGSLTYTNKLGRLTAAFLLDATDISTEWDMDVDRTHLDVQGHVKAGDKTKTISFKATPTSIKITNTFYKPLSIHAKLERDADGIEVLFESSVDDEILKIEGKWTRSSIYGAIKLAEYDIGLSISNSKINKKFESEIWWDTDEKISLSASKTGDSFFVSVTTPWEAFEKQEMNVTQSQVIFTWGNIHHLTISHEKLKGACTYTEDCFSRVKTSSTIDKLDNIVLESKITSPGSYKREAIATLITPFMEDVKIRYERDNAFVLFLTSYGTSEVFKIMVNANKFRNGQLTGEISSKIPHVPEFHLEGKFIFQHEIGTDVELKGKIGETDIMLALNYDRLIDHESQMYKSNVEFTVGPMTFIKIDYDFHLLSKSELKSDLKISSNVFISPTFSIEGHLEGNVKSLSHAMATGYITGESIEGSFNLNHSITDSKLVSELKLELNDFHLSYEANGDADMDRREIMFTCAVHSSISEIDGWKYILNHAMTDKGRKSICELYKGDYKLIIEHEYLFQDSTNWMGKITFNDNVGMVMKLSNKYPETEVLTKWFVGDDHIKMVVKVNVLGGLKINSTLSTPWTESLLISTDISYAKQTEIKGQVEVTYGQSKIDFDGEFDWSDAKRTGVFTMTNKKWKFTPLKIQYEIVDFTSVELKVTGPFSRSFALKFSSEIEKRMLRLQYHGRQEYLLQFVHEGSLYVGTSEYVISIPPLVATPIVIRYDYSHKNPGSDINMNIQFNDKTYKVDFTLRKNEMKIFTEFPMYKSITTAVWKFQEKAEISINFTIPGVIHRSLDVIVQENFLMIDYGMNHTIAYAFKGIHNDNSLLMKAETPIAGFRNINYERRGTLTDFYAELTIDEQRYRVDYKTNFNSIEKGSAEIIIETSIPAYESNKINLNYTFAENRGKVVLNGNLGSDDIQVNFEGSPKMLTIHLSSPWAEKTSLKALIEKHSIKMAGEFNDWTFNWSLKAIYDQKMKLNVSFNLESNIKGMNALSITLDLNGSQLPYKAVYEVKTDSQSFTYSIALNSDKESFNLKVVTPIEAYESFEVNGQFSIQDSGIKTYITLRNNDTSISFSGFVSTKKNGPEIRLTINLPFTEFKTLEFNLVGSFEDQQSLTVSGGVGDKEFIANIFVKLNKSGRLAISFRSTFENYKNISLYAVYDLESINKSMKLNYIWNKDNAALDANINDRAININWESSIAEMTSFNIKGDYFKGAEDYGGKGILTLNGIEYEFKAIARIDENNFHVTMHLPWDDDITINGSMLSDGIRVNISKGTGSYAGDYDFSVNYSSAPELTHLRIETPFDFLKIANFRMTANNQMVNSSLHLLRNSQYYDFAFELDVSPMKSNIEIGVSLPSNQYDFNALYDFGAEEKTASVKLETNYSLNEYTIKALMKHAEESRAYIRITGSDPHFSIIGIEYKIQSGASLKNIDTFIGAVVNDKTYKFGLKSEFKDQALTCFVETPFEDLKKLGFTLVKSDHGIDAGIYFGKSNLVFELSLEKSNYQLNIQTPFSVFSHAHISLSRKDERGDHHLMLKMNINEMAFELNVSSKKVWNGNQLVFNFITPFDILPRIELLATVEMAKLDVQASISYRDISLRLDSIIDIKNYILYVNLNATTPFMGWRNTDLQTNINFKDDSKVFKVVLTRDGDKKEIYLMGKVSDDEIDFNFANIIGDDMNFKTTVSLSRSKRSSQFFKVKNYASEVRSGFNSIKVSIHTPFTKAKTVTAEIVRTSNGIELNYERNENFIKLTFSSQGRKRGFSVSIKSAIPGWELLALTGRLDLDQIGVYVSGHKNQKKIEIDGSGKFSARAGAMKVTVKTPFANYEKVEINFDYNYKRRMITFEAKTVPKSNFHILLEFKRGVTIDIFIAHPSGNTDVKGNFKFFESNMVGSSRFAFFKNISFKHKIEVSGTAPPVLMVEYARNGIKKFELEFKADPETQIIHFEVHGRLFGNHSMVHIHINYKKLTLKMLFNRNGDELKLQAKGSGNLPKSGNVTFTIDNSFREVARHIDGSLSIDRSSSPKKVTLKLEYPGGKQYSAKAEYNLGLNSLKKKGNFDIVITTPTKDRRIWKNISVKWNVKRDDTVNAVVKVGPHTFVIQGKIGLFDTDLKIVNEATGVTRFAAWSFKNRGNGRDYYLKAGRDDRYVLAELHTTYDTIKNGEVTGVFRASRFMRNELKFSEKWSLADGKLTGGGSFKLGTNKGESKYTISRDPIDRAGKFEWSAKTNIRNINNVKISLDYNLAKKSIDFKTSWDTESISFKIAVDDFNFASSSNTAYFHLPRLGDGELTFSHDFTKPLAKFIKAEGKVGDKKLSYKINWTRNRNRRVLDLHVAADSFLFGTVKLDTGFDLRNLRDASAYLDYKRGDKFVNITWFRKRTDTNIEVELLYSSYKRDASVHLTGDWSNGFDALLKITHKDKTASIKVDFIPGKLTVSINTPFSERSNVDFKLDYNMKGKKKTATLHYNRNGREVHLTFAMNFPTKRNKNGTIDIDLTTPIDSLKHVSFNGKWKKGKFNGTYRRNDDIKIDLDGDIQVKAKSKFFHVKFNLPSGTPIELHFSSNLEKLISGKGKKVEHLLNFEITVADYYVKFALDGFRNKEKIFLELTGSTSLVGEFFEFLEDVDDVYTFSLKLDSELNITERVGHFEIRVNEFHFKIKNSFELKENGFYARSQIDTSMTRLPGFIIGFGRDGDACIGTLGYGEDREVTVSIQGNDHFRKGFSGKIDIPRRKINNLLYDISYGTHGPDQYRTNIKLSMNGKKIEAGLIYDSDGLAARLKSLAFGNYNVRAKRSISDERFLMDIGVNDYGLTLEGNLLKNTKGFIIEGQIMGKPVLINVFFNCNGLTKSEGKLAIKTPYMEDISSFFTIAQDNQKVNGLIKMVYGFHSAMARVDFDYDNKFIGDASVNINNYIFEFSSDLNQVSADKYLGTVIFQIPFNRLTMGGSFVIKDGLKDVSGNVEVNLNNLKRNMEFSHKLTDSTSMLGFKIFAAKGTRYESELMFTPVAVEIKFSTYSYEERIFNFKTLFQMPSLQEIRGEIDIGLSKPILNLYLSSVTTADSYRGVFTTKLFNEHALSLKTTLPHNFMNELVEIEFNLSSPILPFITWSLGSDISERSFNSQLNIDSSYGKYNASAMVVYDHHGKIRELTASEELILPYSSDKYSLLVKSVNHRHEFKGEVTLKVNEIDIYSKIKFTKDSVDFHIEGNPITYGNDSFDFAAKCDGSLYELKTALNFAELDHSLFVKVVEIYSALVIAKSPLILTGFMKMESWAIMRLGNDVSGYLSIATASTVQSIAVDVSTKSNKELELKVKTRYGHYKKMDFGVKYVIADVSFFSVEFSPIDLKAECFFGVSNNAFNAGVNVETGIEAWKLTKLEAYVPFDEFSPKFVADVNETEYEIKMKQIRTEFGGHLLTQASISTGDSFTMNIDYRLKAPFRVASIYTKSTAYMTANGGIDVSFDSSLLFLVPVVMNI